MSKLPISQDIKTRSQVSVILMLNQMSIDERKEFLENLPGASENAFHHPLGLFLSSAVSSVVEFSDVKKVIMQEFAKGEVVLSGPK